MKKKLFLFFFGLAACGVFLNAQTPAQTQTLDEAVLRAALKIGADLPEGATVAVVHFRSELETLNDYVVNGLHAALLRNRRVTPVKPNERQVQSVRDGLRFNDAGEIDGESARGIGRLLGAQYLATGSLEITGSRYEIVFTALDTGGGEIKSRYAAYLNPNEGTQLMRELALLLSEREREAARAEERKRLEQARQAREQEEAARKQAREEALALILPRARLWGIGFSLGTSFADPWVIATARGTLAPWRFMFFDIGMDLGLVTRAEDAKYWSLYPFVRYSYYRPFGKSGLYAGAGAGVMLAEYAFGELKIPRTIFAADFTAGVLFWDSLDISYTARTNFTSVNHKLSVGYVYRFK
jgi:hypothetical protein